MIMFKNLILLRLTVKVCVVRTASIDIVLFPVTTQFVDRDYKPLIPVTDKQIDIDK